MRDRTEDSAFDLVTTFLGSRRDFDVLFQSYERTVLELARERGVDRRHLQLPAHEVGALLDFDALNELFEARLVPLRALARLVLRDQGTTDPFDRYVHDIFHEIAILREEHLEVVEYGAESLDDLYSQPVLDEVHEYFPKRLKRVNRLFEHAHERLLSLVAAFSYNKVFIRSLFLFGADWFDADQLRAFYGHVYEGGLAEGLLVAARSFHAGGFSSQSGAALTRAREVCAGAVVDSELARAIDELASALDREPEAATKP